LPATDAAIEATADDLDGNGIGDNALGSAIAFLAGENDISTNVADMIASRAITSTVEIQADDLTNDSTVAVTYIGADGELASMVGGTLEGGSFRSNRTRTTSLPGSARLHLPIFADADPVVVDAWGVEIDLDSDGNGGFNGVVRGGLDSTRTLVAAEQGIIQMVNANPLDHALLYDLLDVNVDGVISADEIATSMVVMGMLLPDIELFDAAGYYHPGGRQRDSLSFAPIADACHDRVRDGDETDVDCGGSCAPCPGQAACSIGADCQSETCTTGVCAKTSCVDGVQDGLETEVDCGWSCPCAIGQSCQDGGDCLSHTCTAGKCAP